MIELMFLIDDYIDEIKETKLYKDYYSKTMLVETKYKKQKQELIDLKIKFDEVMKVGKFHPDFSDVAKEYQRVRTLYYQNEDILLQRKLEKKLQDTINNFIKTITNKISDYIPTLNELGFIEKKKGGPTCGSC
ncbi:MAG TPA: hypothetical protein GX012_02900 [Acholeplasma sp.]|nr:hypothetical protein [Acholeplasma sp.]